MDLRQLTTFRAVAISGSLGQAALTLHYAPSTVTEQVRSLEASLGVELFRRGKRGVTLTAQGRELLPYAERMLALADEARAALAGCSELAGSIVVGGLETLCAFRLPAVISELQQSHPQLQVRVQPGNRAALEQGLVDGELDFALVLGDPPADPRLASEELGQEPLALVVRADHRFAARAEVSVSDLAEEQFVLTEIGCSFRALVERAFAGQQARPRVATEFGSVGALKQCVLSGMGLTLLPAVAVAEELARGDLVALPWHPADDPPRLVVAKRRDATPSPEGVALLQALRERLGDR